MIDRAWFTTEFGRGEAIHSLSLRVSYVKGFNHLPVMIQNIFPKKDVKVSFTQCTDEEKDFHTTITGLTTQDLITIRDLIDSKLKEL